MVGGNVTALNQEEGAKRYKAGYLIGTLIMVASLWLSINALRQSRIALPGETLPQALRSLLFGRPVLQMRLCPEEVHKRYTTLAPDGKTYLTWHSPVDLENACYFDHEHGSDPRSYVGFADSGMPAFGFASQLAGVEETHRGYKVYVSNDDLNGRAWMIVLNQDTGTPSRAWVQHHSIEWHISSLAGDPMVHVRLMADFGSSRPNCAREPIVHVEGGGSSRYRSLPTIDCAADHAYESWSTTIDVAGVFKADPYFEVDNPITAVDPARLDQVRYLCEFRRPDEGCAGTGGYWNGSRRGVLRPGQWVDNPRSEHFYTDPYGRLVSLSNPVAVPQFVTNQGWDTRQCCGAEVVFRIQTFSGGVYIAAPPEPAGLAEFGYWQP
jgi:hypothetical protein